MYDAPLDPESVHGDKWAARIRAEHERLGMFCPCKERPGIDYSALGALPIDLGIRKADVSCDYPRKD